MREPIGFAEKHILLESRVHVHNCIAVFTREFFQLTSGRELSSNPPMDVS